MVHSLDSRESTSTGYCIDKYTVPGTMFLRMVFSCFLFFFVVCWVNSTSRVN
jgi:hypothetical protein